MLEQGYALHPKRFTFGRSLLYTLSIIFAMKQCTVVEWVTYEKVIRFVVLNLSYYMYGFCFSSLCATMVINNQHRLNYKDYIRTISTYFIKNKVHLELRKRAAAYLHFSWEYNENAKIFGV